MGKCCLLWDFISPYLLANKLVCYYAMNAGRKHETPQLETNTSVA